MKALRLQEARGRQRRPGLRYVRWCVQLLFLPGLWILFGCLAALPASARAATVQVTVIQSQDVYPAGGTYPILFRIRVAPQWYIHGVGESDDGLIPTVLELPGEKGVRFLKIEFPPSSKERFPYAGKAVDVYSGEFLIRGEVDVSEAATTGLHEFTGHLSYQACSSNACLPPERVSISIPLRTAPQGSRATTLKHGLSGADQASLQPQNTLHAWMAGAGFWLALLGVLLGGLALNLTPCVYPLIPITVSYFGGRSRKLRGRAVVHGILYVLGLAATNSLLGVAASLSGGMLGAALQHPLVLMGVAGVLVWLALSFFGAWELRLPSRLTQVASKTYSGYFGTFFMGLTLGVVAAPCLGPFILGLLTYVGQKGDPLLGFLYFFVLSIGMGLPLSFLAVFSGALDRLPASGEWMVWVRKVLGWVLLGMAGYMVRPLIPGVEGEAILFAVLMIAAGVHLGWLDRSRAAWRPFPMFKRGMGVFLIGAAVVYLWASFQPREGISWTPYKEALVAEARGHQPVMLDFYADWCAPCAAMERNVFTDPQILALSSRFRTLRVDLTRRLPEQDALLERYGVRGVPTIIFLKTQGEEARTLRIETYLGRGEVLRRMQTALE